MKYLLAFTFLLFTGAAFSQVEGQIAEDEREVKRGDLKQYHILSLVQSGKLIIDIEVNGKGKVTSAKFNAKESTVNLGPGNLDAQRRAKMIRFVECGKCPAKHEGQVVFNVGKP